MINLEDIQYNSEGLIATKHYEVVIAWSEELKAVCYHAQNKRTGVLEIPFRLLTDSKVVLEDLESYYEEANPDTVVTLKGLH